MVPKPDQYGGRTSEMTERLRIAILLCLSMLVYGNTLFNGFTMDDFLYIFLNPAVTHVSFRGLFAATQSANVLRPFTFASLAFNWALEALMPGAIISSICFSTCHYRPAIPVAEAASGTATVGSNPVLRYRPVVCRSSHSHRGSCLDRRSL